MPIAEQLKPAPTCFRPCILTWVHGRPTQALVERMREAARRHDAHNLLLAVGDGAQALLVAEAGNGAPGRRRVHDAVRAVLEVVHESWPEAELQIVVGDRLAPSERFGAVASRLHRLGRYADAHGGGELVWARRYSLSLLLETLDPRQASAFIDAELALLEDYDHEHGTDLQRVLELALDHPSRNDAAHAAFMHRNTFRRQLRKALALIDVDLEDPEERLALHVALKLRALRAPQRLA